MCSEAVLSVYMIAVHSSYHILLPTCGFETLSGFVLAARGLIYFYASIAPCWIKEPLTSFTSRSSGEDWPLELFIRSGLAFHSFRRTSAGCGIALKQAKI
jgi:hypothetical protein